MNVLLLPQFLIWYFWEAPRGIIKACFNFLRFGVRFFSIPFAFKTFFAPWRGYLWSFGRGFDPARYLEVLFSNLVTRLLGAAMRTMLILFGTLTEITFLLGGIVALLGWFLLPFLTLRLLFFSIGV